MFRIPIAVFLILLFTACASTPETPKKKYSEHEIDASFTKVMDCAFEQAKKFDNGITDVRSIAISLISQCRNEFDEYLAIDTDSKKALTEEHFIEVFITFVHEYRSYVQSCKQKP